MHSQTKTWLDWIQHTLPPEALPLAASLDALARSMDAELAEGGRVSASLAGAYRLTHQSLVVALRGTEAAPEDSDADLFAPIGGGR